MESFDTVRQELEVKRQQLESNLHAARGQVSDIEADLGRVDEALGALTGHKKKSRGRSRSRKKPVPSITDLQHHISHIREHSPFMAAAELQEAVRSLTRESGASLSSFKSKFAEALVGSPGSAGMPDTFQPPPETSFAQELSLDQEDNSFDQEHAPHEPDGFPG